MKIDEFDAMECNEAFAAIALDVGEGVPARPGQAATRVAARSRSATRSARAASASMTTMLNHLEATGGRFGFQTMCEGGGQANATVIERLG